MRKNNTRNKLNRGVTFLAGAAMIFSFFATASTADAEAFTMNMKVGSRGSEVSALQLLLAANPSFYPQAMMTGYFGQLTRSAVMRFQAAFGLSADGVVGPMTRAKLNSLSVEGGLGTGQTGTGPVGYGQGPTMSQVAVWPKDATTTIVYWSTNEQTTGKLFYDINPILGSEAVTGGNVPALSGTVLTDNTFSQNHAFTFNTGNLMTNAQQQTNWNPATSTGSFSMVATGSSSPWWDAASSRWMYSTASTAMSPTWNASTNSWQYATTYYWTASTTAPANWSSPSSASGTGHTIYFKAMSIDKNGRVTVSQQGTFVSR